MSEDPALDFRITVSYRGRAFVITEEEIEDGLVHAVFEKGLPGLLSPDAMKRRSAAEKDAKPAETWEYKITPLPMHPNNFNELGAEGWELVGYAGRDAMPPRGHAGSGDPIFLFKRRLP